MEIRKTILPIFVFLTFGVFSQPTEEQLKFRLPDSLGEYTLLFGLDGVGGLSAIQHSEYFYYDIYLDTPDDLLLNNGWSLRLRKRNINDSTVSYSMQLKSEMSDTNAVRFEIEEKELEFYRWVNPENRVFKVTDIIDSIRVFAEQPLIKKNQDSCELHCDRLNAWLASMVGSPITPFQYLQFVDPALFNDEMLKQLEVKMVGKSHRIRGHLVFDTSIRPEFERIPEKQNELPLFFQENPKAVWLLETSLDYSIFYCLDDFNAPVHLREFEVENKYHNPALSALILRAFSQEIVAEFGLIEARESKYFQVRARSKN